MMEFAKWMGVNVALGIAGVIAFAMIVDFICWGIPPVWDWPPEARVVSVAGAMVISMFAAMARS